MKISIRLGICLSIICLLFVSCSKSPSADEIKAQADYELAVNNSDVNGMFISARTLYGLNPKNKVYKDELDNARVALDELNSMRVMDKNNDLKLDDACKIFLTKYPNNTEINTIIKQRKDRLASIIQLRNEADVAEKTYDWSKLLNIYNNLKLTSSNEEGLDAKISKCEIILRKTNLMRAAKADRDHEKVVQYASELLNDYPDYPEAKEMFRTSGKLFILLEQANDLAKQTNLVAITKENSDQINPVEEANRLARASALVDEALKLDPYFTKSQELKDKIDGSRTCLGEVIALRDYLSVDKAMDVCDHAWVLSWNLTNKSIYNDYGLHGWEYYKDGLDKINNDLRSDILKHIGDVTEKVRLLKQLTTNNNKDIIQPVISYLEQVPTYIDLYLSPNGTVSEWGKAGNTARSSRQASTSLVSGNLPTNNALTESTQKLSEFFTTFAIYHDAETTEKSITAHRSLIDL
jgi:hypothetical protein